MNVGTNRGDAHAFKLDTLLKLVDVKAAYGKITLFSELTNVKKAAAMDSDVLSSNVMKLSKGLENIAEVVRLNEAIMGSEESRTRFSELMNRFMKMAKEQIIRIQAQESCSFASEGDN
ncbi:Formin-like protein 1 [Camellia lanceoleosa]|uniref:Formin-like protein 1 n=1 Tax=Camellia lanceoleosa TaxID=1840588 RepID=A0ACC0F7Y0_9ERIC|nr:Formin-like protein 1 [Camellia lanceoleosa]